MRHVGLTFAIAFFVAAVPEAAPGVPSVRTLGNGLVVVLLEDHATPLVSASLWVRAGSRDEIEASVGYAHFLEHVMQRGAGGAAPFEGQRRAHRWGGALAVRASYDRTHITVSGVPAALQEMLETVAAMAFRADLKEDQIEKELGSLTHEVRNYYDDPSTVAFLETMRAAYPGHPYRVPPLGNFRSIGTLKREPLLAFYRNLYVPNNMSLIVAGDFDPARAVPWIDTLFGAAKRSGTLPPKPPAPTAFPDHSDVEKKLDLESAWATLAFTGPGYRHPDRPAFEVLARSLGDAGGAPIVRGLAGSGTASSAQVLAYGLEDTSLLYVAIPVSSPVQAYSAATVALEEIASLKSRGLKPAELKRCVDRILGEERLQAERLPEMAQALGEAALFGGIRYAWDRPLVLARLTPSDVARVASAWLVPENLKLVVLLPKGAADADEEQKKKFHAVLEGLKRSTPAPAPQFGRTLYAAQEGSIPDSRAWGDPADAARPAATERQVLENGFTFLFRRDRRHGLAAASLIVEAGSGYDPAGREGLASLAAHTPASGLPADRGGRTPAGASHAAAPDVAVSRGHTEFRFLGTPAAVEAGLRRLAGALQRPVVPEKGLEDLRRASLAFLERSERDVDFVGQELFREKVFSGHPYAHPSAGTAAGLRAVTPEDAVTFLKAHYLPGRSVLAIAGDFETQAAIRLARELFGSWPAGGSSGGDGAGSPPPAQDAEAGGARATAQARGGEFRRTVPAAQSQILVGVPGPGLADRDFPLVRLLGTAVTLLAFEDMVFTRRAAFSATSLPEAYRDGGALAIRVVAAHTRRDEAVFDIQRLMRRLALDGIGPEDFSDLLRVQAGQDAAAQAGVLGQAGGAAWREVEGPAPPATDPEALKDAAARYLRPEAWIVVKIGPPSS